jgi:CRP-like cAMP-binding protein
MRPRKRSPSSGRSATARSIWRDGNRVLSALPATELAALSRHLETATLASGDVLYPEHVRIEHVYFPDSAVISFLKRMSDGSVIEVGTIGNEGVAGLSTFLGGASSSEALAQIPGSARRMPADEFRLAIDQLPTLRRLLGACTHAFMMQMAQTVACNRLHDIEQRCARWLLLTHDRVGGLDTFPLTHKFLSFMLGVRRAGVTEALGSLAKDGLIQSAKGHVTILDRPGLEAACCECYAAVRSSADVPFEALTSP